MSGQREWKPGDVAMLGSAGSLGIRVEGQCLLGCAVGFDARPHWHSQGGAMSDARDARPLVVIDPEDREHVERLCEIASRNTPRIISGISPDDHDALTHVYVVHMQAALREFANPTPPKAAWTDGDVVLVWNSTGREGLPIVISRIGGKWLNHRGSEWEESAVEDAIESRGKQQWRCGEVLRRGGAS